MASMGGGNLNSTMIEIKIKGTRILNRNLMQICQAEGLRTSGVKTELQDRLIAHAQELARVGDAVKLDRLRRMIDDPSSVAALQPQQQYRDSPYSSSPAASSPAAPRSMPYGGGYGIVSGGGGLRITFKHSPFYEIQTQIGTTKVLEVMKDHRHTVSVAVRISDNPILNNIPADKSLRVMVFCAGDGQANPRDIAFPYNSEIKVNGGEFKANLRGLKNKAGSTRPVDITDALRLKPSQYSNNVELTWALSDKARDPLHKKFYFMVNVVKTVPVTDLVKKLAAGKKISKPSVVNEMLTKARDPDIVAVSTVLSLKCPLSTLRIELPCRSITCRHNQCFDATSYMQLQEQGPTWLCPICNNSAPFESLAVDEYVKDILTNTSKSVDQVTIEPDGVWSKNDRSPSPSNVNNGNFSEDDDLIEIKDTRLTSLKYDSTPAPSINSVRTPPISSREASAALPAPRASISGKRPAAQVIDLTLSDGEDEEPVRAPKRQYTSNYHTPQSMFSRSNGQGS